jgi:hypothetical protein
MTARVFALTAFLAVALAGCSVSVDPAEPPPSANSPADPSELIIRKWKLVKRDPVLVEGFESTYEFGRDGLVTRWMNNPLEPDGPETRVGRYRIEGNNLQLSFGGPGVPRLM